jgi:hypothetical protein
MAFRLTLKEAKALGVEVPKKPHKYRAQPEWRDGYYFDAQLELKRYCYLKQVEMAGVITDLEVHPVLKLYADSPYRGAVEIGAYEADFAYSDTRGRVIEDCKGALLPLYILKRKLVLANYPTLVFMEVRLCKRKWSSIRLSSTAVTWPASLPTSNGQGIPAPPTS